MKIRPLAASLFLVGAFASAQTYEVVQRFTGIGFPILDRLTAGPGGVLYGAVIAGGPFGGGTVFSATPNSQGGLTYVPIHAFSGPDGRTPYGAPILAADGDWYGTTSEGGANDKGTIYRIDPTGSLTVIHNFDGTDGANPYSELFQLPDSTFFGTAANGGTGSGTAFRMDVTGAFIAIHAFSGSDGANPDGAFILASDGYLYGTTHGAGANGFGTVFQMDADCNVTTVHDFTGSDGSNPGKHLVQGTDGRLYGVTAGGGNLDDGTIFALDLATGTLTTLHSFSFVPDGSRPLGGLVQAPDGWFYGTASNGGNQYITNGGIVPFGSFFRIDAGGAFEVIQGYSFFTANSPVAAPIVDSSGVIWGSLSRDPGTPFPPDGGGIFSAGYFPLGGIVGSSISAGLVQASDGNLYGTTARGGVQGVGTIFRNDTRTFTILRGFLTSDPWGPAAPLIQASDALFYGTGFEGGDSGGGGVFTISLAGDFHVLHAFDSIPGLPTAPVLEAPDGLFYGTTYGDVYSSDFGTLYRVDSSGAFTSLYTFDGSQGASPRAGLIEALDGKMYGVALGGGSGHGTVFRLDGPGSVTAIHAFDGTDGDGPWGGLIQDTDGTLYGTTMQGGANGFGTVFKMDTSGKLATLHDFAGTDGANSHAGLFKASDGNFYGTTSSGGADALGTVFKMDSMGTLTTVHDFAGGTDGRQPEAGLIEASDGWLYGTTSAGGVGNGTIFRIGGSSALEVDAIQPTSGQASGGASITVLGHNFSDGATFTIGGLPAPSPGIPGLNIAIPVVAPPLPPGTLNDVTVTNTAANAGQMSATVPGAFFADFLDVRHAHLFHDSIEIVFRHGITVGCGGGKYCPNDSVSRQQMAVFLLKAMHGSTYTPPPCQGAFIDVPCPSLFADWIEQLAAEGITGGCGGGNYCPTAPVRRDQMAAFLLKAEHGSSYVPPVCQGVFTDVACPSLFADWIEQLAAEQITGGCGGGNYCPQNANTRGQMAVFLVKTFGLQ